MKTIISTDRAPKAIGPYSQAVRLEKIDKLLFVSGQIPIDVSTGKAMLYDGDIAEQCRLTLSNLKNLLASEKLSLENVVKTTVYLKNMDDFSAMNQVYGTFFVNNPPARATVAVSGLPAGVSFEIDAIVAY